MHERIVLLVDDEPHVIAGLMRSLRKQPYQIYSAPSGEEAMKIFKANRIDLVVSDEKMSGMQGSEFLAWVATQYPKVPRIMLTGELTSELAIKAVNNAGVFKFFVKPCNEDELAAAIMEGIRANENQPNDSTGVSGIST